MRSQYNRPLSIPVENLNKQKGCHSGARPPDDITLIFYTRWAVDAIESLYVALRILKRRPIISKPFVEILSLTLQNDTTGRMAKAIATDDQKTWRSQCLTPTTGLRDRSRPGRWRETAPFGVEFKRIIDIALQKSHQNKIFYKKRQKKLKKMRKIFS